MYCFNCFRFSGTHYIHTVMQPSLPSISRMFLHLWKLVNPQSHNTCYYWSGEEPEAFFLSPHSPSHFLLQTCSLASATTALHLATLGLPALPGGPVSWGCVPVVSGFCSVSSGILFFSPSCKSPPLLFL